MIKLVRVKREQFITVIKENQNLIYKICLSYCKNAEDRKDLQQDILVKIWYSMDHFDGRAKLSTWIYRIALNTAISFYRNDRKQKYPHQSLDSCIIELSDIEDMSCLYKEEIGILYQFIEQQNELDRALLLLYLDNIKYSEIASILGITETNVATKVNRLKKRIKIYFEHF